MKVRYQIIEDKEEKLFKESCIIELDGNINLIRTILKRLEEINGVIFR